MNRKLIGSRLLLLFSACVLNGDVLSAQKPNSPSGAPVLHMIAVYEGEPNKNNFDKYCRKAAIGSNSTPLTEAPRPSSVEKTGECIGVNRYREVIVNVSDKTAPLVLALSAYNYVTWIIKPEQGVVIEKVILMGYHTQKVTGLGKKVPVEAYTYESSPCPTCWQGDWREGMNFYDAKEPPKELKGISDLPVSTFQRRYKGGEFSIYVGMKSLEKDISNKSDQEIKSIDQLQKQTSSRVVSDPKSTLELALRKGVIRKATIEDIRAFRNAYIVKKFTSKNLPVPENENALSVTNVDLSHAYVVLKSFVYPLGVEDEKKMVFFVPKGVPAPSGEFGLSAVYDFETLTVSCTYARTGSFGC